jgi:hypothetical protein
MAAVRNLGLFPSVVFCPRQENSYTNDEIDRIDADIWIESTPPFLYACAHYWRVKTWRISASTTWAEFDASIALWTDSFSETISQGINREIYTQDDPPDFSDTSTGETPSSETQLVCNNPTVGHDFARLRSAIASGGSQSGVAGTGIFAEYTFFIGGGTPAFYRLDTEGNVSQVSTPFTFQVNTTRWKIRAVPFVGNTGSYGTLTYSLLGQTFTAPLYARNSLVGNDNTLSISASLTAAEYWPYDPGDGDGPIYDSATGEQLRGFPS